MEPTGFLIRPPRPGDHLAIVAAVREWTDRRDVEALAPVALLEGAADTCFVAEDGDGAIAGFVVAFESAVAPGIGYIHFVWVSPEHRGRGVARALYGRVFRALRQRGCRRVEAVTATRNEDSLAFHRALGFVAGRGDITDHRTGEGARAPAGAGLPDGVQRVLLVHKL